MSEELMYRVSLKVPKSHYNILSEIAKQRNVTMTSLALQALDNEILKEKPFQVDVSLPDISEFEEYTYASQATKIIQYIANFKFGIPLESLAFHYRDIGLESVDDLRHGLAEAVAKNFIDEVVATHSRYYKEGTVLYKPKKIDKTLKEDKVQKNIRKYKRYMKMQKQLKKEGLIE